MALLRAAKSVGIGGAGGGGGAGTWSTQSLIPRFPLPRLEDTLNGYLESVEPLLSMEDRLRTRAAVTEVGIEAVMVYYLY